MGALRAIPIMIACECGVSDGQAPITIASSASTAALSAAPFDEINEFPDDFAVVAGPVSPTRCKSRQYNTFFYLLTFGSVAFPLSAKR